MGTKKRPIINFNMDVTDDAKAAIIVHPANVFTSGGTHLPSASQASESETFGQIAELRKDFILARSEAELRKVQLEAEVVTQWPAPQE